MMGDKGSALVLILATLVPAFAASPVHAESSAPVEQVADTVDGVTRRVAGTVGGLLDVTSSPTTFVEIPSAGEVEDAFLAATNDERGSHGLRPLAIQADLVAAARRQSVRMESRGDIWHNVPGLLHEISGWAVLGENVGRGPSVEDIQSAFMASPTHRANVLDTEYTRVGIGAGVQPDGYIFVTLDFERPAHPSPATEPTYLGQPQTVDVLLRLLALDHQ